MAQCQSSSCSRRSGPWRQLVDVFKNLFSIDLTTMVDPGVPPPLFSTGQGLSAEAQAAVNSRGNPATLNLDDIFGDICFTAVRTDDGFDGS